MRAAVLVAILASATLANAQAPGLTPPSPAPPSLTPPSLTPPSLTPPMAATATKAKPWAGKQRSTAYLASIAGSLVPVFVVMSVGNTSEPQNRILLAGASAMLLPSAGHWYAGEAFTPWMGIRIAGGAVATLSLLVLVEEDDGGGGGAATSFLLGTLAVGAGAILDIATAGMAVDRWNRDHALPLAPTAMKVGNGYGLGVVGQF